MKLPDRLKLMADLVSRGETVADIGTDHGYLPIYLTLEGISPKVILTDISPGSAAKAAEDCSKLDPEREYDIREGDGLTVLRRGEVDTVVMAGMGGILISHIMEADPVHTQSFRKFILQPRSHVGYLRHWLHTHGYRIDSERLVREGQFICEVLVCSYHGGDRRDISFENNEELFSYPDSIMEEDTELAMEYLEEERNKLTDILEKIGDSSDERKELITRKIERIDKLLDNHEKN